MPGRPVRGPEGMDPDRATMGPTLALTGDQAKGGLLYLPLPVPLQLP